MITAPSTTVPLANAAQALGMSWHRTWNLILTGKLIGEQRDGKWHVDADSLADVQATRSRNGGDNKGKPTKSTAA